MIESFQAAFLEVATATLPVADYAVKGGVNMRFFFGSVRSSKDMDFDEELWPVLGSAEAWEAMRDRVVEALEARALELLG